MPLNTPNHPITPPIHSSTTTMNSRLLSRVIDADGDGIVSPSECNSTHPCQSLDQHYICTAGSWASQSVVKIDGGTCTTWQQCQAVDSDGNSYCGDECDNIDPPDEDGDDGGYDWEDWWPSDDDDEEDGEGGEGGGGDVQGDCDTGQFEDCNGDCYVEDTYADWLGDDYCDEGGNGPNLDCGKFVYDCCDCSDDSGCQGAKRLSGVCGGRRRRRLQKKSPASWSAEDVAIIERETANFAFEAEMRRLDTNVKMTACIDCTRPQYCPQGTLQSSSKTCPSPGFYCTTERMKRCKPGYLCLQYKQRRCALGSYCPQNTTKELVCPQGSYCPEPAEINMCPPEFFCRGGNVEPQACPFYATCKEGAKIPEGGTVSLIGVLLVALALFESVQYFLKRRRRSAQRKREDEMKRAVRMPLLRKSQKKLEVENSAAFKYLKPDKTAISFSYKNLSLSLKGGKRIISGVTGHVSSGKMTAIMGPSGCGKTTMLNVLRNKASYGEIGGELLVNGRFKSIAPFRRIVGFVPQEDILHGELRVEEEIMFASLLKNSMRSRIGDRRKQVGEIIKALGLVKCKDSIIGDSENRGVSGGQRKRVSIAVELVANPSACFLDEPTSGLDSTTSIELVEMLKEMSNIGMTLVMVIHQPR